MNLTKNSDLATNAVDHSLRHSLTFRQSYTSSIVLVCVCVYSVQDAIVSTTSRTKQESEIDTSGSSIVFSLRSLVSFNWAVRCETISWTFILCIFLSLVSKKRKLFVIYVLFFYPIFEFWFVQSINQIDWKSRQYCECFVSLRKKIHLKNKQHTTAINTKRQSCVCPSCNLCLVKVIYTKSTDI